MMRRLMVVAINAELDVVASRQRARQIAAMCGFGQQDQVKIKENGWLKHRKHCLDMGLIDLVIKGRFESRNGCAHYMTDDQ